MTSYNLAVCIANSLIYPKDQASNSFVNAAASIIQLMIDHHKRYFPSDSSSSVNRSFSLFDKILFVFLEKSIWINGKSS